MLKLKTAQEDEQREERDALATKLLNVTYGKYR
jgi:hypothetical protein